MPESDVIRRSSVSRTLMIVFVVALVVRVLWVAFAHVTPISDFAGYDRLARRWLESGQFGAPGAQAYRTPGYPAFLAAVYWLLGESVVAAAATQAVLGAFTSALVAAIGLQLIGRQGWIAGALYAASPTAIAYVPVLASENVATLLVALVTWLLCAGRTRSHRWARSIGVVTAGLATGALILVRPAGLLLAPGWLWAALAWRREGRRRWGAAAVYALACGLALAPWIIRNAEVGLGFPVVATTSGVNLWLGNNPAATHGGWMRDAERFERIDEMSDSHRYRDAALAWIASDAVRYGKLSLVRLHKMLGPEPDTWAARYFRPSRRHDAALLAKREGRPIAENEKVWLARTESGNTRAHAWYRIVLVPLLLIGLCVGWLRFRSLGVLVAPLTSYVFAIALTFGAARLREMANPIVFVLVAAAAVCRWDGEGARRGARRRLACVIAVLVSLAVYGTGWVGTVQALRAPPPPQVDLSGFTFDRLEFDGARDYRSAWTKRIASAVIEHDARSLTCVARGVDGIERGQYAGVVFDCSPAEALRFSLAVSGDGLRAVYVDAIDESGERVARWTRRVLPGQPLAEGTTSVALRPGAVSGYFFAEEGSRAAQFVEVHVFVSLLGAGSLDLTVADVEVARPR